MKSRLGWVAGGIGLGAAVVYRLLRRPLEAPPAPDSRAEELKSRIAESRAIVDDREEFEAGETPVDRAEPATSEPLEDRRKHVHERGQAALERMHRSQEP